MVLELTDCQKEIIGATGNLVLKSSAGTGKTQVLVSKIAYDIKVTKTHKAIAAVTFTIKATHEIKIRTNIDIHHHFVGTLNSFAIEEIIKPFIQDAYGSNFNIDIDIDYSIKFKTYDEGLKILQEQGILGSYGPGIKKSFVFDLAKCILKKSIACETYLKSTYFKIYVDEYQDCDSSMHEFFLYVNKVLFIELFIVGDPKQSIYMWRGASPEFLNDWCNDKSFQVKVMHENHRSSQQIQNYSNLLNSETQHLYREPSELTDVFLLLCKHDTWEDIVSKYLSRDKTLALLRYKRDRAELYADKLTKRGYECTYIPQPPVLEIFTSSSWLYEGVAKYSILTSYSVYDFFSEIPFECEDKKISIIYSKLEDIFNSENIEFFSESLVSLAEYLGCTVIEDHIQKLYETINDRKFHNYFYAKELQNVSMTFHSSKGLEFDQVILFAEDYNLNDFPSVCNHYVSVTRSKERLIVICLSNPATGVYHNLYYSNFKKLLKPLNLKPSDVMIIKKSF